MFSKENIQQKIGYMAEAGRYLAKFEHTTAEELAENLEELKKLRREIFISLEELQYICLNIAAESGNKAEGDLPSAMQNLINMKILPLDLAKTMMKIFPMKMELMRQTRINVPQLLDLAKALPPVLRNFESHVGNFLSRIP